MKYRMLNDEELSVFEEDFKHFLIVNGVHAEEWEAMNKNEPDKALQMVELFSDTVLQKVYEGIKFVEHRSKESVLVFKCESEKIELISLNIKPGEKGDLSSPESIHEQLTNNPSSLTIFKSEKEYNESREIEIHQMISSGCVLSTEDFWNSLELILE